MNENESESDGTESTIGNFRIVNVTRKCFRLGCDDLVLRLLSYLTFSLFVSLFCLQLFFLWNTYQLLNEDDSPDELDALTLKYGKLYDLWLSEYNNGELRVNTSFYVR